MARLLLLLFLVLAVAAMAALAVRAVSEAVRQGGRTGHSVMARGPGGENMQKIAFAALIVLLVGVTSGLIGGL